MDPVAAIAGEPRNQGAAAAHAPDAARWLNHPTTPADERGPLAKLLADLEAEIERGEVYTREEAAAVLAMQPESEDPK